MTNEKERAAELPQIVRTAQKSPPVVGILNFQATNWHRFSNGVSFVFSWMRSLL